MVKGRKHTPEQIVRKLGEVDRLLGEGRTTTKAVKRVEVSEKTHYRRRMAIIEIHSYWMMPRLLGGRCNDGSAPGTGGRV